MAEMNNKYGIMNVNIYIRASIQMRISADKGGPWFYKCGHKKLGKRQFDEL